MQTMYPKMSTSLRGRQDKGRWVEAEFSHQEGALAQLEVEMCARQGRGFQEGHARDLGWGLLRTPGGLSLVTAEEASQVCAQWSATREAAG